MLGWGGCKIGGRATTGFGSTLAKGLFASGRLFHAFVIAQFMVNGSAFRNSSAGTAPVEAAKAVAIVTRTSNCHSLARQPYPFAVRIIFGSFVVAFGAFVAGGSACVIFAFHGLV